MNCHPTPPFAKSEAGSSILMNMNFLERFLGEREQAFSYTKEKARGDLTVRTERTFPKPYEDGKISYDVARLKLEVISGDEVVNLEDFLPPGVNVVERQDAPTVMGANVSADGKQVELSRFCKLPTGDYPYKTKDSLVREIEEGGEKYEIHEFLSLRGALLMFLHECGHVHNALGTSSEEKTCERNLRIITTGHDVLENKTGAGLDRLGGELLEKYIGIVLQEERDAWYYALRVLRELRSQGIDLESEMTTAEILQFIRKNLDSYGQHHPEVMKIHKG